MSKSLVWITAFIGILFVAGYILYSTVYFSTVEISIEGEHNPTKSLVLVGEEEVYPSGKDGRSYTAKVRPGTHTVSYQSYNVKTQEKDIEFSFNSTEKVIFKTTAVDPVQTASELIKIESGEKILSATYYGSSDVWLVAEVVKNDTTISSKFYIYEYSETGEWSFVVTATKISAQDPLLLDAPKDLKRYIESRAGD